MLKKRLFHSSQNGLTCTRITLSIQITRFSINMWDNILVYSSTRDLQVIRTHLQRSLHSTFKIRLSSHMQQRLVPASGFSLSQRTFRAFRPASARWVENPPIRLSYCYRDLSHLKFKWPTRRHDFQIYRLARIALRADTNSPTEMPVHIYAPSRVEPCDILR